MAAVVAATAVGVNAVVLRIRTQRLPDSGATAPRSDESGIWLTNARGNCQWRAEPTVEHGRALFNGAKRRQVFRIHLVDTEQLRLEMRTNYSVVAHFHHHRVAHLALDREFEILKLWRTRRFPALEPRDTVLIGE